MQRISTRFTRREIALIATAILCTIAGLPILSSPPPPAGIRLKSGELISRFGRFLSPTGRAIADLQPIDNRSWRMKAAANNPQEVPSTAMTFTVREGWIGVWDDQDRFWIYVPHDGVRRFEFLGSGGSGTTLCGEGGGWDNIPQSLLDRLPPEQIEKYNQSKLPRDKTLLDPA